MNQLQPATFRAITDLFFEVSGIRIADSKQALVFGRLQKLALDLGAGADVEAFAQRVIARKVPDRWLVDLVDRLTTNETYFFREAPHFDDLALRAAEAPPTREFRVWSAASSSGEEAYSIAMCLAETLGFERTWSVHGTDLSTAMVQTAINGLYPLERARDVSLERLRRFCMKGEGPYEGMLLLRRELRARAHFQAANLMEPLPTSLPQFDVIFLRNVLIYFDPPHKVQIVRRVLERLAPHGVLYSGHAESLTGLALPVRMLAPAIYAHA